MATVLGEAAIGYCLRRRLQLAHVLGGGCYWLMSYERLLLANVLGEAAIGYCLRRLLLATVLGEAAIG